MQACPACSSEQDGAAVGSLPVAQEAERELQFTFERNNIDGGRLRERDKKRHELPNQLHILSTDMHISPVADLKHIISSNFPLVHMTDLSLSGACGSMNTCAQWNELRVLRPPGSLDIIYDAESKLDNFFDAYREGGRLNSTLVTASDAVHCSHPAGMCEYYMPFNRSLIIWSTTRFEQGREISKQRLQHFIKRVRAMAFQKGNALLANNVFDQHYVHYFTGLLPVYIPSLCGYISERYSWSSDGDRDVSRHNTILAFGFRPLHFHGSFNAFVAPLTRALDAAHSPFKISHIKEFSNRERYSYADISRHPAVLHLPYQVSTMSFFEQYMMGIPIIAPSHALLVKWHLEYGLVSELTWNLLQHGAARESLVPRHRDADEPHDPNKAADLEAVSYWLGFADYYTFPHIVYFNDWDHLARILSTIDLSAVSADMLEHGRNLRRDTVGKWKTVLDNVIPASERPSMRQLDTYEGAMNAIYGSHLL
ncbi:MAG: hypothetical protein EOO65_00160 [Methanosarcinales archaeon]|nr:MAG: hypothetical protein EOO65_00160 [Methanosarcinales archaeon]